MKLPLLIAFLTIALLSTASIPSDWIKRKCPIAEFYSPKSLKSLTNGSGIDSEAYSFASSDLTFSFDNSGRVIDAHLQTEITKTIQIWSQRKNEDWGLSEYIDDGGTIHSLSGKAVHSNFQYYLYFGFDTSDLENFSIHIYFQRLNQLEDIRSMLQSITLIPRK